MVRERDTRLVARIVARLSIDDGAPPESDFSGFPDRCGRRRFFDLMDHIEKFHDSPVFAKLHRTFTAYYQSLGDQSAPFKAITKDQLKRIYGIVRTNSFRFLFPDLTPHPRSTLILTDSLRMFLTSYLPYVQDSVKVRSIRGPREGWAGGVHPVQPLQSLLPAGHLSLLWFAIFSSATGSQTGFSSHDGVLKR